MSVRSLVTAVALLLLVPACHGAAIRVLPVPPDEVVVVDDGWLPLPVLLVPSLPPRNHRHNVGWTKRPVERTVTERPDGVEVWLKDGDGYSGAPLGLRFGVGTDGALLAWASGGTYSCVSDGDFLDVHGPLRVDESLWASGVVRFAFTLDAIDDDLLSPLRMEGSSQVDVDLAGWGGRVRLAHNVRIGGPIDAQRHAVTWRWADGSVRATGSVDALGRRQGLWATYTREGALQTRTEFVDGAREGLWEAWHPFGVHETGRLVGGKRAGEWVARAPDGTVWRETHD